MSNRYGSLNSSKKSKTFGTYSEKLITEPFVGNGTMPFRRFPKVRRRRAFKETFQIPQTALLFCLLAENS